MLKKVILGLVGFVALIVIISVVTSRGKSTSSNSASTTDAASAIPTVNPATSAHTVTPVDSTSPSGDSLTGVYTSICSTLGAGASESDVISIVDQQLQKDSITGYSGTQIVHTAEQKDCPQYLSQNTGTVSEQQALTAAQGYLSDGQGFSRQGLIDQLDSSAGDGFSEADATWAVDHSDANWDQQAVEAAKGYMQMGGFSRSSLIDQLTSSAGDKFTYSQAVYAADKVGL